MTDDMDCVYAHLSSHGDFTEAEINEVLGVSMGRVHAALLALEGEGLVERRPAARAESVDHKQETPTL